MEHYFTTRLINARIVRIKAYMPNCQDPACESFTHLEEVSFAYGRIEWSHEAASTSSSDDWETAGGD
jgi:type VI secretion system secreted protein Hcp